MLDTCVYIDLMEIDAGELPSFPQLSAVTMAELHQGVATARTAAVRVARTEMLTAAIVDFDPLPFDAEAAARYGTLVALTLSAHRDPRPRRMDLMVAAVASSRGLPLYTRNAQDFRGLDDVLDVIEV